MRHDDIEDMVKKHIIELKPVDTELLMQKLRPVITHKCENIRKENRDFFQAVVFFLCCVLTVFIGFLMLFPDYIDYNSELVQFSSLGLTIGFFTVLVFLILRALLYNAEANRDIKLRGRMS